MNQSNVNLEKKGNFYALASGLLYGLLGYFGMSLVNSGLSSVNVSFWRFFLSSLFMLALVAALPSKKERDKKPNLQAFINGALFYSAPSTLFFIASQYIGTGQCMVIFFSFPAFVMILNRVWYGQKIRPEYFFSFAIIIVGLVLLVDMHEARFDLLGIGLSLLSAVSYAVYVVQSKKVILPVLQSTLMVSLGCCFTSLVLALLTGTFEVPTQNVQWVHFLGIAIFATALPILLMLIALKYISSERASLLAVLEPMATVVFGVILLDEVLTIKAFCGIMLTLAGAMSVSIKWKTYARVFSGR